MYLRHLTRHVHETITQHVETWMGSLGWMGPPDQVPFGTSPALFQVGRMDEASVKQVTGNLIAISYGDEPEETHIELGGGLVKQDYIVYIDCLADEDSVALAMANDVKDCLLGNAPLTSRFLRLHDHTNAPPTQLDDYLMEFTDVVRRKPEVVYRANWHVIQTVCEMVYPKDGG